MARRNNVSRGRGDEFYTRLEDVAAFFDPILDELDGRRVMCPCDGPESAFVRYFEDAGVDVEYAAGDFDAVDFDAYDLIITNPPFSRLRDFVQKAMASTAGFVIVVPVCSLGNENITEAVRDRSAGVYEGPRKFMRPSGRIDEERTAWLSTIHNEAAVRRPQRLFADEHDRTADGIPIYDRTGAVPWTWDGVVLVPGGFLYLRYDARAHQLLYSDHNVVGVGDGRRRYIRVAVACRPSYC